MFLTVAVEDVLELGDRWGDLQPEVEDLLLALETNVLWPPNHAREVAGWLDVLADAIVAGTLLDEGVLGRVSAGRNAHWRVLDMILQMRFPTYLGSLLRSSGFSLREWRGRRFLCLWWHFDVEAVIENRYH